MFTFSLVGVALQRTCRTQQGAAREIRGAATLLVFTFSWDLSDNNKKRMKNDAKRNH